MEEDFDLDALLAGMPDIISLDLERRPDTAFDLAVREYETSLPRGYLSQSQIGKYLKCGSSYEKAYVLGIRTPGNSKMAQGSAVHVAADTLHKSMIYDPAKADVSGAPHAPLSLDEVQASYSDAHDKAFDPNQGLIIDEEDADLGKVKDRGMGLVKLYREAALGQHVQPVGKGETPGPALRPIFVQASERAVKTTIVQKDPGGVQVHDPVPFMVIFDVEEPHAIRDLKVRGKLPNKTEVQNSIQLELSAEVAQKPDVALDMLIKPSAKLSARMMRYEHRTTPESRNHAVTIATEVADDVRAGRFRRTDPNNWWCDANWCGYYGMCRGKKS